MHAVAPALASVLVEDPLAHVVHSVVDFPSSSHSPATHDVHATAPVLASVFVTFPGEQTGQEAIPTWPPCPLKVPAGHGVHGVRELASSSTQPAEHGVHVKLPFDPSVSVTAPGMHTSQAVEAFASPSYFPAWH